LLLKQTCQQKLAFFRVRAYRAVVDNQAISQDSLRISSGKEEEVIVIISGDVESRGDVAVRVHDQCFTSEVLGSLKCDCQEQLQFSLEYIQKNSGVVIYTQQEGRGIGLANKIAAYALQETGVDTVDANRKLGFPDDSRQYGCVFDILRDLRISSIHLLTNNPRKIAKIQELGIQVKERIPIIIKPNPHNVSYLGAKEARMGHMLRTFHDHN